MRNSRQILGKDVSRFVSGFVGKFVERRATVGAAGARSTVVELAILTCLALPLAAAAGDSALPAAHDLRAEAADAARHGQPLLILYSRSDCAYCDELRRTWLRPLAADSRQAKLGIRQIDLDSEQALLDFAGRPTTHARFAASEQITFVPVVAVYGPRGQRLAEPIVGVRLPDFYGAYLSGQLDEARARLRAH